MESLCLFRFVSSEPSLADPLNLVSISSLPTTPPPKNDSLLKDKEKAESVNVTEEVADAARTTAPETVKKDGVSDATLPPDLVPKGQQLPTSTPSVVVSDETKPEKPADPPSEAPKTMEGTVKPGTPTPDGTPVPEVPPVVETVTVETPSSVTASNASEEEIPSFNEWAQKKLADAEKRKGESCLFFFKVKIRKL
jgi:hypothetical protein